MDAGNNKRGAYAPVTVPMQPNDNPQVETKPGAGGAAAPFWTRTKIAILVGVVLVIVVVIIIIAVTASNKKGKEATGDSTTPAVNNITEQEMASSSAPILSTLGILTTVTSPPATTTTLGPPVRGTFSGVLTLDKAYDNAYDDEYSPEYSNLETNITLAIDALYRAADTAISSLSPSSTVSSLGQNRTYTDAHFTVSVSAIERGAREYLVNQLDPLPSSTLDTYRVLYVSIGPEAGGGGSV